MLHIGGVDHPLQGTWYPHSSPQHGPINKYRTDRKTYLYEAGIQQKLAAGNANMTAVVIDSKCE